MTTETLCDADGSEDGKQKIARVSLIFHKRISTSISDAESLSSLVAWMLIHITQCNNNQLKSKHERKAKMLISTSNNYYQMMILNLGYKTRKK